MENPKSANTLYKAYEYLENTNKNVHEFSVDIINTLIDF